MSVVPVVVKILPLASVVRARHKIQHLRPHVPNGYSNFICLNYVITIKRFYVLQHILFKP